MDLQEIQSIKQRFGIIGNSPKLNGAIQTAIQVAPTDMTVMITGESGTGKESFSKIIHQLSHRKHGQFIAINCGAIPAGTIDSELFGHEKGSFTGAIDSRKGYFEVTNGGTIFLDEIGEMPLETQARLLRILENGEFIRVGSSKVQKTDVRVLAATNVKLLEQIDKGEFREDLFYRLSVPIAVPPLRERGNDVDLLFRYFAVEFSEKYHIKPISLDPEAREMLLKYRWPGNIRQLKNIVDQISVLEVERSINAETLLNYLPDQQANRLPAIISSNDSDKGFSERDLLYKVLFDMRNDVTELKKLVLSLLQNNGPSDKHQIIQKHKHLFNNIDTHTFEEEEEDEIETSSLLLNPAKESTDHTYDLGKIEDITPQMEDESLSLQKKEKEMIIKALKKNNNRRKYAAKDLGISERTLYRKIKQYELEDI
ncbi:sigma-54 dependent transcriptional regulator [Rapidithrix thailandica]|uniref:Sigma-54 dependent transcriptional regulator n=1 Tax=Rapidithrix thailandica TaxID=413964 RepID=A0AAW9SEA0_9BACT